MKQLFLFLVGSLMVSFSFAQTALVKSKVDTTKKLHIVETACGECQFKMKGNGCHLAVRIDGKAYFVDGTSIDEHGDAHAKDGFCNAVRKAEVQGTVVKDRFKVSYFKLVKEEKKP